jgi:haloalkane dehalogenase
VAVTGIALQVSGFAPGGEVQSQAATAGLRIVYAGLPLVAFAIGIFLLGRLDLDARAPPHRRLQEPPMISPDERYEKKSIQVKGSRMAYVEVGEGDPIVFLHGNPTSSYLWRNVMPHCEGRGRLIAPDLIGMGDSEKLEDSGPDRYRFVEHREYLDGLLEALGVDGNVTFVIHDWGSALGFDWANRHRDAMKGIAYMEGIVMPLVWSEWPKAATAVFQGFRSDAGEAMVLEQNVFVEQVLPTSVIRKLEDAEMEVYRRPFREPGEGRRPTLTWPRQIPLEGEPADVVQIVEDYGRWLASSDLPKLFVNAEPGAILRGAAREFCRSWPNTTEVTVAGIHFVQEDSPDEIGRAVADWYEGL